MIRRTASEPVEKFPSLLLVLGVGDDTVAVQIG
jgi:hypothetical protein